MSLTENQIVLARMHTSMAMQKMRSGPVRTTQDLLMKALAEAIADARRRRMQTLTADVEELEEERQFSAQIARLEAARLANR